MIAAIEGRFARRLWHTGQLCVLGCCRSCLPDFQCCVGAEPSVRLLSSLPSPQPVGTVIGLTAVPKDEGDPFKLFPKFRLRFSVSTDGSEYRIVSDFSQQPLFAWRPELYEHDARVKVTLLNIETKKTAEAEMPFRIVARVTGQQASATPTTNPLVALFSFPPCPSGSQYRVAFRRQGETDVHRTGLEPCRANRTSNMYVAGMRSESEYMLNPEVITDGKVVSGQAVPFRTGITDGVFAPMKVSVHDDGASKAEPFLVYSVEVPRNRAIATDLNGNVVWYMPGPRSLPDTNIARRPVLNVCRQHDEDTADCRSFVKLTSRATFFAKPTLLASQTNSKLWNSVSVQAQRT